MVGARSLPVPELPEVETARRILERHAVGKVVRSIEIRLPKLLRDSPLPDLDLLVGHRLLAARRRAKVLMADFEGDLTLLMHLKLAGQVAVFLPDGSRHIAGHPVPKPDGDYPHKATHVDVMFDDRTLLYISDVRQFGWLRLMPTADVDSVVEGFSFGPEATGDLSLVPEVERKMRSRGIPIKTLLLDQTVIAGLGNIYVDEALFATKIHPERPAASLTGPERKRLLAQVPITIAAGIEQGGAKIINSRAYPIDGFPAVHGREGEPCFVCGTPVRKIRVGQRGTYYCPTCQKPKRPRAPRKPVASGPEIALRGE